MRKIGNPQERIPDRAKQRKPLRGAVSEGMKFFRKNASLAPRRSGFDSRRLHLASTSLRSVNG
jgi:hypothetical protein